MYHSAKACHYVAALIGPGLRDAIPEEFITPDMCTPIFPNTDHPAGRPPVHTEPPFPFANCCHWFGPDMDLEVRVKIATDEEICEPCRPLDGEPLSPNPESMPPRTRRKMGFNGMMTRMQAYDVWRVVEMERMHEAAGRVWFAAELPDVEATLFPSTPSDAPGNSKQISTMRRKADKPGESTVSSHDAQSVYSETSEYCSSTSLEEDDDSLVCDDNPDCLPTLRVWTNLAAHLAQEDIPDPVAFMNQYHAVTR